MLKNNFFSDNSFFFNKKSRVAALSKIDLAASNDFLPTRPLFQETQPANEDSNYKLIKTKNQMAIVPRESFIKQVLHAFNQNHPIAQQKNLLCEGFDGDSNEEDSVQYSSKTEKFLNTVVLDPRKVHFKQLFDLPIFNNIYWPLIPDMKNGHLLRYKRDKVDRILMLRPKNRMDIIGAIFFSIDLESKTVNIRYLSVDYSLQKQGLGSFLLESALLVSMLYGVSLVQLQSTDKGVPLYLNHDFYMEIEENGKPVLLKDVEKIIAREGELPLVLSMNDSISHLSKLMQLPGLNEVTYQSFQQWLPFEQLLNLNQGKITENEWLVLATNLKMSDSLRQYLINNLVTVISKRENDSMDIDSNTEYHFSRYRTPNELELYSLFRPADKQDTDITMDLSNNNFA